VKKEILLGGTALFFRGCRPAFAENDPPDHFPGASAPKEQFPPVPQPQSAQVRFMRTLLVSVDFTADSISATGGNRRFIPLREKRIEVYFIQTLCVSTFSLIVEL
jgi:hypothetical protein